MLNTTSFLYSMRPTGGAPGAPISTIPQFVLHLTVATYDVGPSPTGARPNVGGALHRSRGTPSPPNSKESSNKGRSVGVRVRCCTNCSSSNICMPNAQRARRGHGKHKNTLFSILQFYKNSTRLKHN